MQGARNGQDIFRTNAAETASRRIKPFEKHSSGLEGAGRNRVTILGCFPRGEVTSAILGDDGKTGTSTVEDDGYDGFGRRNRTAIS